MLDSNVKPPCTLWAQRQNKVLITIELGDCKNPTIELTADKLFFKGTSNSIQAGTDHNERQVTIEFYKPIKVDESKYDVRDRATEFVIVKEEASWWPRLLKDQSKQHWLKIDFPKWKDEDETDEEDGGRNMMGMPGMPDMSGMGGMAGMGGGMPNMGNGPGDFSEFMKQMQMSGQMPDFDDDEEDDDDGNAEDDAEEGAAVDGDVAENGDAPTKSSSNENEDNPPPLS